MRIGSVLAMVVICTGAAFAAPVMTPFDPAKDGFRFANTFLNELAPGLDVHTGGLCGGMTYAVLDYYHAHRAVPNQDYRPANGTMLQQYFYTRQVDSLVQSLDRWTESLSPGAAHNGEFFRRGLETGAGSPIAELRSFIDKGVPIPLGLQAATGQADSHQVLAIGYDLGENEEGFRIFLCDPNFPGRTMRLAPDLGAQLWIERDEADRVVKQTGWLTWFVCKTYQPRTPPHLLNPEYPDDGKVYQLLLTIQTGAHELRGGDDDIDLTVNLTDGTREVFPNINLGGQWLANYEETAAVTLTTPVPASQIQSLVLSATFTEGSWDMQWVRVRGKGGATLDLPRLAEADAHRFTGADPDVTVTVSPR